MSSEGGDGHGFRFASPSVCLPSLEKEQKSPRIREVNRINRVEVGGWVALFRGPYSREPLSAQEWRRED